MSHRQLVFVHHDKLSGQLSRENAIKVWTYVSRRPKPKHQTFKKWHPPSGRHEEEQALAAGDFDEIIVPFSQLRQFYASKNGLHPIESPTALKRLEFSSWTAYSYCSSIPFTITSVTDYQAFLVGIVFR